MAPVPPAVRRPIMLHPLGRLVTTTGRAARAVALHPAAVPAFGVALLLALAGARQAQAGGDGAKGLRLDLMGGADWLNTDRPIAAGDLNGRIVLVDFWTLCCINCIHTLPDLAKLEARYPGVLVVIGVHSPKFENEKKTESIRKAILRYEIKHPVINDADQKIWRRYDVDSWPTLVLIDTEGNIVGSKSGEGHFDLLDHHIGKLVKEAKAKGTL